jgi:hypothetical protein
VAAIRGIWDAPSPPDAVQAYLDAVERGLREKREIREKRMVREKQAIQESRAICDE